MSKWSIALSICLLNIGFAEKRLRFSPPFIDLGQINQGVVVPIQIAGKNLSSDTVQIEQVIPQGIGPQNLEFPKSILPNSSFTLKFDYNTKYLKNNQVENITTIVSTEEIYPVELNASVTPAYQFSPPVQDLGYVKGKKTISVYAWPSNLEEKPQLKLSNNFNGAVVASMTPVQLDVRNLDKVKEVQMGNSGLKIDLTIDSEKLLQGKKRKSINQLISFESSKHPNAAIEIHITGYQKDAQ